MRYVQRSVLSLVMVGVLGCGVMGMSGCSTASPGVTNQAGTYVAAFDAGAEKVTKAAEAVCKDLKLSVTTASATELDGLVVAKTAKETEVKIKVARLTDKTAQVSVRVGYLGDGELSKLILEKIKEKL